MTQIFHLAEPADWASAQQSGAYRQSTRGRTLADDGFIHASTDGQWQKVRRSIYAEYPEALVLLAIDSGLLTSEVRMEVGDPASGELFPHIYGPIDVSAVVAVRRLEPPHT